MPDETHSVPEASQGDRAHTLVRAALSAVPFVGGPATELFTAMMTPPLVRRRDEWMRSVAESLMELEQKVDGFDIGALSENESFVSAVMHASEAALRNHQKEKLEALRNAVLNVACGKAPGEDLQLMFINLVDTLTPWHVRILVIFQEPAGYCKRKGIKISSNLLPATLLESLYPELQGQQFFCDLVVRDLHNRGLLTVDSLRVMTTAAGTFTKLTTEFGDQFVRFISPPISPK